MHSSISGRAKHLLDKLLTSYNELDSVDISEENYDKAFTRRRIAQNLLHKLRSQILSRYKFSAMIIVLPPINRSMDSNKVMNGMISSVAYGLVKAIKILILRYALFGDDFSSLLDEYHKEISVIRELLFYAVTGFHAHSYDGNKQSKASLVSQEQDRVLAEYDTALSVIPPGLAHLSRLSLYEGNMDCDSIEFDFTVKRFCDEKCQIKSSYLKNSRVQPIINDSRNSSVKKLCSDIGQIAPLYLKRRSVERSINSGCNMVQSNSFNSSEKTSHKCMRNYREWLLCDGCRLSIKFSMFKESISILVDSDLNRFLKMEDTFVRATRIIIQNGTENNINIVLREIFDELKTFRDNMLIDFPVAVWLGATENFRQECLQSSERKNWLFAFNSLYEKDSARIGGGVGVLSSLLRLLSAISTRYSLQLATEIDRSTKMINDDSIYHLATQTLVSVESFLRVLTKEVEEWNQEHLHQFDEDVLGSDKYQDNYKSINTTTPCHKTSIYSSYTNIDARTAVGVQEISIGGAALLCYEAVAPFLAEEKLCHVAVRILIKAFYLMIDTRHWVSEANRDFDLGSISHSGSLFAARVSAAMAALEKPIEYVMGFDSSEISNCENFLSYLETCCSKNQCMIRESFPVPLLLGMLHLDSLPTEESRDLKLYDAIPTNSESGMRKSALLIPTPIILAIKYIILAAEYADVQHNMIDRCLRIRNRLHLSDSIECLRNNIMNVENLHPSTLLDPSKRFCILRDSVQLCNGKKSMIDLFSILEVDSYLISGLGEILANSDLFESLLMSQLPTNFLELQTWRSILSILLKLVPLMPKGRVAHILNAMVQIEIDRLFVFSDSFEKGIMIGTPLTSINDHLDELIQEFDSVLWAVRHTLCDLLHSMISRFHMVFCDDEIKSLSNIFIKNFSKSSLPGNPTVQKISSRLQANSIIMIGKLILTFSGSGVFKEEFLRNLTNELLHLIIVSREQFGSFSYQGVKREAISLLACIQVLGFSPIEDYYYHDKECLWLKYAVKSPEESTRLHAWLIICELLENKNKNEVFKGDFLENFQCDALEALREEKGSHRTKGKVLKFLSIFSCLSSESKDSILMSKISIILDYKMHCRLGRRIYEGIETCVQGYLSRNRQNAPHLFRKNGNTAQFCSDLYREVYNKLHLNLRESTTWWRHMTNSYSVSMLLIAEVLHYLSLYHHIYPDEASPCTTEALLLLISTASGIVQDLSPLNKSGIYFVSTCFRFLSIVLPSVTNEIPLDAWSSMVFPLTDMWLQFKESQSNFALSSYLDITATILDRNMACSVNLSKFILALVNIYEKSSCDFAKNLSNYDDKIATHRLRQKCSLVLIISIEKLASKNSCELDSKVLNLSFIATILKELKTCSIALKGKEYENCKALLMMDIKLVLMILRSILQCPLFNTVIREEFPHFFDLCWLKNENCEVTFFPESLPACALGFLCNFVAHDERNKIALCETSNASVLKTMISIALGSQTTCTNTEELKRKVVDINTLMVYRILINIVSPGSPSKCRLAVISMFPKIKPLIREITLTTRKQIHEVCSVENRVLGALNLVVVATLDKHGRNLTYKRNNDIIIDIVVQVVEASKKSNRTFPTFIQSTCLDIIRNVAIDSTLKLKLLDIDNLAIFLMRSLGSENDTVRKSAAMAIWCLLYKSSVAISRFKSEFNMSTELNEAFTKNHDIEARKVLICINNLLTNQHPLISKQMK